MRVGPGDRVGQHAVEEHEQLVGAEVGVGVPGLAQLAGEPQQAGAVAGALTTAVQLGGALGVAIVGILFYGNASAGTTSAFGHGLVYLIAVTLAVAALVQALPRHRVGAGPA